MKRYTAKEAAWLGAVLRVDYEQGSSVRDIVEDHNIPYTTAHRLLTLAGVVFRKRGGDTRR